MSCQIWQDGRDSVLTVKIQETDGFLNYFSFLKVIPLEAFNRSNDYSFISFQSFISFFMFVTHLFIAQPKGSYRSLD